MFTHVLLEQEGAWEGQRGQQQGAGCGSAPTSGSLMKSSAIEDSARESYSPAELENLEKVQKAHYECCR